MPYTIDTVARLTGISAFTLRNWEKRYDFLKPNRLENGFRTYDNTHVELLKRVFTLVQHGAKIGELADSIKKGKSLPELILPELDPEVSEQAQHLYSTLLRFDTVAADSIYRDVTQKYATRELLDRLFAPLLLRMNKNRDGGSSSAAQTRFAINYLRTKLSHIISQYSQEIQTPSHGQILIASPSGELHEAELLLLMAQLRLNGWTPVYLGAGASGEEILKAAQAIQPAWVCASFKDSHELQSALPFLGQISSKVALCGFGALTFNSDAPLPHQCKLIKSMSNSSEAVTQAFT